MTRELAERTGQTIAIAVLGNLGRSSCTCTNPTTRST